MTQARISILVTPFRDLSPEGDSAHFAAGFVEDLTADLSRFASLRVLAAQSTFALGQSDLPLAEAVREWNVDYVLNGSVRRSESEIRMGVQLVRVDGDETVWAERFDAPLERVFDVQDEIGATVAGRLAVHVDEETLARTRARPPAQLAAYECWLRGMDCLRRGTLEGDEEARPWFEQALEVDPNYARAYAGLSLSHFNEWTCQAWHLWDENERNAFDYATLAVQHDERDAIAHAVLSRVHRFRRQHADADHHAARALALNPNDAGVLIQVAISKLFGGEPVDACELARKAITLNPLHGNWYHGIVGWNLFLLGEYDEAFRELETAGEVITNFAAYRAAVAATVGDAARARREYELFQREYRARVAFGREPEPGEALSWAVRVEPFRRLEDSQHMPDALRKAGLDEVDVEAVLESRETTLVQPAGIARPPGNVFRRENGIWTIDYEGSGAQLVELKGFHDIARLLAQPGEPLHCLELSGSAVTSDAPDDVLDVDARRRYRRRIEELQAELESAEADNDPGRADPTRRELDVVIDELARATGLRGRSRKLGAAAERARSAVTWRIRSAIKKISAAHPRLGQHLSNSIRTGHFCHYSPETPTVWDL